jgi:hypothetical protein
VTEEVSHRSTQFSNLPLYNFFHVRATSIFGPQFIASQKTVIISKELRMAIKHKILCAIVVVMFYSLGIILSK